MFFLSQQNKNRKKEIIKILNPCYFPSLQEKITQSYIKYAFVVVVALSLSRYVFYGKHMHKKIPNKSVVASKPLTQLYEQKWFNTQYFGSMDSFFIKYLAKKNE